MTLSDLFLSVAITLVGVGAWKLVARYAMERGHPERLSQAGGAVVGLIAGIVALVVTAPAPEIPTSEIASRSTAPIQLASAPAPAEVVAVAVEAKKDEKIELEPPAAAVASAPIAPAARPVAVAATVVVPAVAAIPLIEPAIAIAAEPPAAVAAAKLVPAPPSDDPARLAYCAKRDRRADVERRARNKFGVASDRLEPGEDIVLEAATAVAVRSDDAARRSTKGIGAATLAQGTRIKIQQRFGRPGGWVWYQIYIADADTWRYTTSRELGWVNRSARGKRHEAAKKKWIDGELAKGVDAALEARAVREQWRCDDPAVLTAPAISSAAPAA